MSRLVDFIIPARNEVYLGKTIENILANIRGDSGVIVVCDGYWPDPPIQDDPRVTLVHHTESIGQRAAINEAARLSQAKFIMKLDAHSAVSEGIDVQLANDWQEGWTLVPTMINLDHETWQPKMHKQTKAMYLTLNEKGELRAEYYGSHQPKFDSPVHESMACMGCGWFLSRDDFWAQDGCDENHGSWGAQSVEVSLKAWLSGGALMTDENCYFSHWFRGGGGPGFPYKISGSEVEVARKYSRDLWLGNKWPKQVRTLQWLAEKFSPPGWENIVDQDKLDEVHRMFYPQIHAGAKQAPLWRGVKVIKFTTDLLTYEEVIWANKPRWIIETGTKFGGSALFFQDMLDMVGEGGRVVTVDKYPVAKEKDPRITYLEGGSTSTEVLTQVRELVSVGGSVMVVLDSDHSRQHVKRELVRYSPLVTSGQYLVVEDCYEKDAKLFGPGEARDWFLGRSRDFVQTNLENYHLIGVCRGGWLKRK